MRPVKPSMLARQLTEPIVWPGLGIAVMVRLPMRIGTYSLTVPVTGTERRSEKRSWRTS